MEPRLYVMYVKFYACAFRKM